MLRRIATYFQLGIHGLRSFIIKMVNIIRIQYSEYSMYPFIGDYSDSDSFMNDSFPTLDSFPELDAYQNAECHD